MRDPNTFAPPKVTLFPKDMDSTLTLAEDVVLLPAFFIFSLYYTRHNKAY